MFSFRFVSEFFSKFIVLEIYSEKKNTVYIIVDYYILTYLNND